MHLQVFGGTLPISPALVAALLPPLSTFLSPHTIFLHPHSSLSLSLSLQPVALVCTQTPIPHSAGPILYIVSPTFYRL